MLGALAATACTKHNPASCCTSPLQCAAVGLNEMHECQGIEVCDSDGTCVPPECVTSADCKDSAMPLCSNQVCVSTCTDDNQCSAATPHCGPAGACVECTESAQCPSGTPVCDQDTNTCVQAPPACVPELLVVEGNAGFGLLSGQLLRISPKDFMPKPVFTTMDQSDGAYSPDGSKLAWVKASQKLWVGDADGENAVQLADVSQASTLTVIVNPRWSPDGTHLSYVVAPVGHEDQFHVWTSALTGSPTNITSSADASSAEWSPSGAKLVFQSVRTGDHDIFTMSPDGSNQTNLTHATRDQQGPHWSPDGNSITYVAPYTATSDYVIWRMNSDGSQPLAITSAPAGVSDSDPHWVSNQQIVYVHTVSGVEQLYITGAQGTNQHAFAPSATNSIQVSPMPSPDGKFIAWSEDDSTQTKQVWISSVDAPMPIRVTNSSGLDNVALGWKPCP